MSDKKTISIWDTNIIKRALVDSFLKLDPRKMMKNPVMFVVEVGAVLTTIVFFARADCACGWHEF